MGIIVNTIIIDIIQKNPIQLNIGMNKCKILKNNFFNVFIGLVTVVIYQLV